MRSIRTQLSLSSLLALTFGALVACGAPPGDGVASDPGANGESAESTSSAYSWIPRGTVRATLGGRCLDVKNNGTANRTPVQIYDCSGSAAQDWYTPFTTATGPLYSASAYKALDAPYGNSTTWIFDWWNGANQRWSMPSIEIRGLYGKCLDVPYGGDSLTWIFSCHGGDNQRWAAYDDGTIRTKDGRCLGVADYQSSINVTVGACVGGWSQKWTIHSGGQILKLDPSNGTSMCLDQRGGSSADRTAVQLYPCNGTAAQSWHFRGELKNEEWNNCLSLPVTAGGPALDNFTQPVMSACGAGMHQWWEVRW